MRATDAAGDADRDPAIGRSARTPQRIPSPRRTRRVARHFPTDSIGAIGVIAAIAEGLRLEAEAGM